MAKVVVQAEPGIKIGVVSDTHGYFDPRLPEALAGTSAILHAGDAGSEEVLDELRRIAPVHAVRGNVDGPEVPLPPSATLEIAGLHIEMMHVLPLPQSELEAWAEAAVAGGKAPKRSDKFLGTFKEETSVIVFGHTHSPCLVLLGDRLFFNPGSAGKKRFSLPRCCGLLEVAGGQAMAWVVPLEGDGQELPKKVLMEIVR